MKNYKEQIKGKETEIAKLEKDKDKYEKAIDVLNTKEYDEKEPFQKKKDKISDRYQALRNPIDAKDRKANEQINKLNFSIKKLEQQSDLDLARESGQHNVTTFKAFLRQYDFDTGYGLEFSEKKALKNGIQIFRLFDERNYTMWIAFNGLKFVGLSYRRAGQHRGDETTPYSFIGGLEEKNIVKKRVPSRYDEKKFYLENKTYTEWSRVLGMKNLKTLKTIPMNKKNKEQVRYHRGWDY